MTGNRGQGKTGPADALKEPQILESPTHCDLVFLLTLSLTPPATRNCFVQHLLDLWIGGGLHRRVMEFRLHRGISSVREQKPHYLQLIGFRGPYESRSDSNIVVGIDVGTFGNELLCKMDLSSFHRKIQRLGRTRELPVRISAVIQKEACNILAVPHDRRVQNMPIVQIWVCAFLHQRLDQLQISPENGLQKSGAVLRIYVDGFLEKPIHGIGSLFPNS